MDQFFSDYNWISYIILGSLVTLKYTILPIFVSLLLGSILAVMQLMDNKFLKYSSKIYISIIRGTPLLLQLSFYYFVLPKILKIEISTFKACFFALSLNSSAYVAEIIKSGIQSIDRGQFEAAQSLSIGYKDMMRDIILPQALRNVFPAIINEIINLIKESAIISVIGEADIMRRSQIVSAATYNFLEPLLVAGCCYYVLVMIFSYISKKVEDKINFQKQY